MRELLDKKSSLKMGDVLSARVSSQITATSFLTTSIPAAWEGHGETIIRKTSRLSTGGAMVRKVRPGPNDCLKPMTDQSG